MNTLTDAENTEFEPLYRRLLRERFGNTLVEPSDELEFCRELKRGAQAGDVPHGGEMHHVVPAEIDYTNPATIAAIRKPRGMSVAQLSVLSVLALVFIAYVLVTLIGLNKSDGGKANAQTNSTPTAVAGTGSTAATPTPLIAPTVAAGFVTVAGEALPPVRPNSLELGGRSFLMYVAPVKDGNWAVRQEPGVANWVPGSIVNWSFALFVDGDPGAQAWLERLQAGKPVTLRIADGRALLFSITERREISRSQTEFLDPHRPGLTVAIKYQPGDSRLLIRAIQQPAGAAKP